jgi:hypothetical protein
MRDKNYYIGNCTNDEIIDYLFGDASEFARLVEEHGDNFTINNIKVTYDEEADVHSFNGE